MVVGTDKSFLKLKFSQEIVNNGEKCGWLKQMRVADENMIPTNSGLMLMHYSAIVDVNVCITTKHLPYSAKFWWGKTQAN